MTARLYHPADLFEHTEISLTDNAAQHAIKALRLKQGAAIILFNGQGGQYHATISQIHKKQVVVNVTAFERIENESGLHTHLGQVISRGKKMDLTIQKAVELGVNQITPLVSERCGVKLAQERWEKKLEHWHNIIISACEQCGRNRIPTLNNPCELREWVASVDAACKILCHPKAEQGFSTLNKQPSSIALLIGPEGGLSEPEVDLTLAREFGIIRLGPRILRTETAGLVQLSLLQYLWGDLG